MDARLEHGDVLGVVALGRIGRRSRDVMGKIYDRVNRGVRLRSLADNEAFAKGLDPDPESLAHPYPLPLRPGLHPPGPVEGGVSRYCRSISPIRDRSSAEAAMGRL